MPLFILDSPGSRLKPGPTPPVFERLNDGGPKIEHSCIFAAQIHEIERISARTLRIGPESGLNTRSNRVFAAQKVLTSAVYAYSRAILFEITNRSG